MNPKMQIKKAKLQRIMLKSFQLQEQGYTKSQALRKAWQWMKDGAPILPRPQAFDYGPQVELLAGTQLRLLL